LALLGTPVTILGAWTPLCPCAELAVLLACLSVARLRLRGAAARLSPVLHSPFHLTQALRHTAAAFSTALAPSAPGRQLAVTGHGWLLQLLIAARGKHLVPPFG
jgi:hypothetical protein